MDSRCKFAALLLLCSAVILTAQDSSPAAESVAVDQTPALAHVSNVEMEQIKTLLESDPDADWERARASDLRFKRVELAGHNSDGLLVRATSEKDCGATGNCTVWVLQRLA